MNDTTPLLWPNGVCPMLDEGTNGKTAVEHYHLSPRQVKAWCNEGCSVECGKLLMEKMEKGGRAAHGNRD